MDYNWEYPGYAFGTGYKAEAEVDADYAGLRALLQGKIHGTFPAISFAAV